MTATQTMEVVYGLFDNMKVVMDGTEHCLHFLHSMLNVCPSDGKASIDSIRGALGMINLDP